jgi:hypothetical protein
MATGKFTLGMTAGLPDASSLGVIFLGLEDFVAADHTFSNCC